MKKKSKIGLPVCFIFLFVLVFFGSMTLWQRGWEHSAAEGSTSSVNNHASGQDIITVDTTFYNYRYDNEIYHGERNQGAQSCYDDSGTPFAAFNKMLSSYYSGGSDITTGVYTGNFYHYYRGLQGSKGFSLPSYSDWHWAANIANRRSPYDSVCQGIVCEKLAGFEVGKESTGTLMMAGNGTKEVPYFNEEFLTQNVNGVAIGAVMKNVGFPFRKVKSGSKKGYYEFDSAIDVVRFSGGSGSSGNAASEDSYYFGSSTPTLDYYYNESQVYYAESSNAQFFPFNQSNSRPSTSSEGQKKLDYGFGVRYNIPFRLSEDGTVDGNPMVFEFSGDDDVWVFVDGTLALDLGGQHGKATGTIDFSYTYVDNKDLAKCTVAKVTYKNGSTSAADTASSNNILDSNTYIKYNETSTIEVKKGAENLHVITVFYMERGMFESNFHMAFNFVPANAPTPAPTIAVTPNDAETADGTLQIQNKLVLPTTTPEDGNSTDVINSAFLDTVKDMAEEDVFSYSVQNQGTKKVGDSGIKYPSGVLSVRQNQNTTDGKTTASNPVKSYLSFGAKSKIRIYFNIAEIENAIHEYANSFSSSENGAESRCKELFSNYTFSTDTDDTLKVTVYAETSSGTSPYVYRLQKVENQEKIYYGDFESDVVKIKFRAFEDRSGEVQWNNYLEFGDKGYDGALISFGKDSFYYTNSFLNVDVSLVSYTIDGKYPPLGGGTNYSDTLPSQAAGDVKSFAPDDNITDFQAVANTSYRYTVEEKYLAPTASINTEILANEQVTSGITNASGGFGLFHDDSATFISQFAEGSRMKVEQNSTLLQPKRYSDGSGGCVPSSSVSAEEALTTFETASSPRNTADYYYTTVHAIDVDSKEINVTYDGQYNFANTTNTGTVSITETFTNTVKTGSLTISKKLNGNAKEDETHTYAYEVSFSNVFGSSSTEKKYSGKYTLIKEDGSEEEKDTSGTAGLLSLSPKESVKISGIPVGTEYSIVEKDSNGNTVSDGTVVSEISTVYEATLDGDAITSPTYEGEALADDMTIDKTGRKITGVIPCRITNKAYGSSTTEFQEVNVNISYTNQFGSLEISKVISGDTSEADYDGQGQDKQYEFLITYHDGGGAETNYTGDYHLKAYTYPNGYYNEPVLVTTPASVQDGKLVLKAGEIAEICEIPLDTNRQYTIQEQIESTDIYYVEDIYIVSGKQSSVNLDTASVTSQTLSVTQPAFHAVYTNRYSNSYIQIDKYVDCLYDENKEYANEKSYRDLTNAKQGFLFEIEQYKTQADAEKGDTKNCEKTYEAVLYLTENDKLSSGVSFGEKKFSYKSSQKIKVLGNRYYRIREKTDWSWKYILCGVKATPEDTPFSTLPSYLSDQYTKTVDDNKEVILKSYPDSGALPVAVFYNQWNKEKEDIDGDKDSAVNKIYK